MSNAGAEIAPEPEMPEPDAVALLLLEEGNRRLRATVQQLLEGAVRQLDGTLRCAAKVLAPNARAANGAHR